MSYPGNPSIRDVVGIFYLSPVDRVTKITWSLKTNNLCLPLLLNQCVIRLWNFFLKPNVLETIYSLS